MEYINIYKIFAFAAGVACWLFLEFTSFHDYIIKDFGEWSINWNRVAHLIFLSAAIYIMAKV